MRAVAISERGSHNDFFARNFRTWVENFADCIADACGLLRWASKIRLARSLLSPDLVLNAYGSPNHSDQTHADQTKIRHTGQIHCLAYRTWFVGICVRADRGRPSARTFVFGSFYNDLRRWSISCETAAQIRAGRLAAGPTTAPDRDRDPILIDLWSYLSFRPVGKRIFNACCGLYSLRHFGAVRDLFDRARCCAAKPKFLT